MKTIYEFSVNERNFALLKPNRDLRESAQIFLSVTQSNLIKEGVLTHQMLSKRLIDDGGALSEAEKARIVKLFEDYRTDSAKLNELNAKLVENLTEEEAKEKADLIEKIAKTQYELNEYMENQNALFDNTVESMARTKLISWWLVNLALEKKGDKYEPLYAGKDYRTKIERYDELNEIDSNINSKFLNLVYLWFYSQNTPKKEEFDLIIEDKKEETVEVKDEKEEQKEPEKAE